MHLWLLAALLAFANPTLLGRVTDSAGKPVSRAAVRLTAADGRTLDTATDSHGAFRFEIGGRVELEISHAGFRTVHTSEVVLAGEDVYQFTLPLRPGEPSDVEHVVLQLDETQGAETAADPSASAALPKSDRLFGLRGGVNISGIAEGTGGVWMSTKTGNVFTSSSIATSVNENADFSAEDSDAAPSYDQLPAAGDAFHGNMHYFVRNDAFDARNFFDPWPASTPPFKYNFFGGDGGGRVGNSYLYSRYWGLRMRQSLTRISTVPDPAWRTGNFSDWPYTLIDPETGFPFANNQIPANRFDPNGLAFAQLYPEPNMPEDGGAFYYRGTAILQTGADAFGFRMDRRLADSDDAFAEYQFYRDTTNDPFNLLSGITNLPSFGVHDALQTQSLKLNNAHVFSPNVVHQLRITFNYLDQPRTTIGVSPQPAVLVTNLSDIGHAANLPQHRQQESYEISNDVSWQDGSSATKVGALVRYFPMHASADLYGRGQYQFTDEIYTCSPCNSVSNPGNPFANLLLGFPTNALQITGNTSRDFQSWTMSFYAQREWRPFTHMSAVAGLRYDYQSPFHEAHNLAANFDSESGTITTATGGLYRPDWNNWGPRFAFSWAPVNNLLVRAGYGIYYDVLGAGDAVYLLGLNPPFVNFDIVNNDTAVPDFSIATAFNNSVGVVHPSAFSTPKTLANPYLQQWSLTLERELPGDFLVQASYFGQKGTRLRRELNINQPYPGSPLDPDDRRPFPGLENIFQFETSASSIGHAAELRATRRFAHGFSLTSSYRFERLIDDATLISELPQNSHDLRGERGLADFQMKHRLAFSTTFNLPAWPLLKGWQAQAVGSFQSGMPLSALLGTDIAGTGAPITNRPNLIADPNISNPTPLRFFNTAAFQIQPTGTFGNSGRNVIIGPGYENVDASLSRTFRASDFTRMQFRADFYDVFNHPNFVAPPSLENFEDDPADFGKLFVALSPRILQFGLRFLW